MKYKEENEMDKNQSLKLNNSWWENKKTSYRFLFGRKREEFYDTYIRTYIERDIRQIIKIKDETKFIRFISSVAARTAQEYNSLDIVKDVGIDSKTVDVWISILKNTNIIYMLQSYSNNNVKKAIKKPKIYFMDTGLRLYK